MSDKPILFSAPMVRALLEGRKTQTRRVLKPQPSEWTARIIDISTPYFCDDHQAWGQMETIWSSPSWDSPMGEPMREEWHPLPLRFAIGVRLWVREAWRVDRRHDHEPPRDVDTKTVWYEADGEVCGAGIVLGRYRHARFMPRWASRLTLTVTNVRVERLQDISEEDAWAEGIWRVDGFTHRDGTDHADWSWQDEDCDFDLNGTDARDGYSKLWDHINGAGAWEENPWVVAVSFSVALKNIDR